MNRKNRSIDTHRRHWLALAGGVWAGVGAASSAALAAGEAGDPAVAPQRRAWPKGLATPALQLPSQEGPPWSLAAARGTVVVLNFWASWCAPCRNEMPSLELLAQRHEADGVQVMAVNFRETQAAIQRFTQANPLTLPILRDGDGAAARAFGVRIFPTTIAIGRHGHAVFSVTGEADWTGEQARHWVAALL